MRGHPNHVVLAAALLGLCACANHNYAPGPGRTAADFPPDSANCRLFARGTAPDTSFSASGSPKFVAAAAGAALLVGAVGTAIQVSANYDDCMVAHGWLIADGRAPAAPVPVPVAYQPPAPVAIAAPVPNPAPIATPVVAMQAVPAAAPGRRSLGIKTSNVTDFRGYAAQLDPPRGVVVLAVMQGGAASAAGLQVGDVILSFGATPLMSVGDLQRALAGTAANSVVPVDIWRDRQELAANLQF